MGKKKNWSENIKKHAYSVVKKIVCIDLKQKVVKSDMLSS